MTLQDRHVGSNIATAGSQLIGDTPLFELARVGSGSRLLLKMEQLNPTGSCKVRMAREMILAAEREGRLKPGGLIVESRLRQYRNRPCVYCDRAWLQIHRRGRQQRLARKTERHEGLGRRIAVRGRPNERQGEYN